MERELARNTTFEVDYIGNKGSNLLARQNINQSLPLANPAACYANHYERRFIGCSPASRFPYQNFVYRDQQFLDRVLQLQRDELQV